MGMRIAVATIAKNEAQFVERWMHSVAEADYAFVLDTGSTDDTTAYLHDFTAYDPERTGWTQQVFNPWRFDHARNTIWQHIPDDIDYVIWLDMDEVLVPGWRQTLETIPEGTTRPRYKYVWSWNTDGSEGLVYGGDKICARHGYTWKHPVHEVLQPVDILEQQHWVDGLEIHHHPDPTKSRRQYFDLLKLAVEEEPNDDRNQFYLGREYFYQNDRDMAVKHLTLATMLSKWPPEKAAAYRMMYRMNGNPTSLYRALQEDPCRRETLVALAQHYHNTGNWPACRQFAETAIDIRTKPLDYLCEPDAWGWLPYDLAALACWHLGDHPTARLYGLRAIELNPGDPRLQQNLEWYTSR